LWGVAPGEDGESEDAAKLPDGLADGAFEVALEVFLDEVGDDFSVGFGAEGVAFLLKQLFQL